MVLRILIGFPFFNAFQFGGTFLSFFCKQGNVFQDAVFNQTVTIIEREDGLDGET